ncbi:MAG: hypothetical protein N2Z64_04780 [Dictyoglomus thermophilum]|nr:hypothetical protein [Dictyoglomus thermophilum]MCX7720580.1 hypothetical protein [Dictyoglomus thermophilum]
MALGGMVATSVRAVSIIIGVLVFKIPINFNNIWISLCLLNNIGSPLWSWHDALKCFSTFRERDLASCKSSSRTYLSFLWFFPVRVFPFIVALFVFFTSHYFGA